MIVYTVIQPERWPTRTGGNFAGRYVLCLGEDRRVVRWEEIVDWLAQCPPLRNIETFWFIDNGRRLLMVTGEER